MFQCPPAAVSTSSSISTPTKWQGQILKLSQFHVTNLIPVRDRIFLHHLVSHIADNWSKTTLSGKMVKFSTSAAHLSLGWTLPEPLTVMGSAPVAAARTHASTLLLHLPMITVILLFHPHDYLNLCQYAVPEWLQQWMV